MKYTITIAALALFSAFAAEVDKPAPKLTPEQREQWKDAIIKAQQAEISVQRLKDQAAARIAELTSEQQKVAQEAQALSQKLLKDAGATGCELTISGEVKCPPKAEAKK